jgi:hypothetical protein
MQIYQTNNGFIVREDGPSGMREDQWVFESTESLLAFIEKWADEEKLDRERTKVYLAE